MPELLLKKHHKVCFCCKSFEPNHTAFTCSQNDLINKEATNLEQQEHFKTHHMLHNLIEIYYIIIRFEILAHNHISVFLVLALEFNFELISESHLYCEILWLL